MKKIGIVTLYNGNINYGGQLQARAMQKLFTTDHSSAKIISFQTSKTRYAIKRLSEIGFPNAIKSVINKIHFKLILKNKNLKREVDLKHKRFYDFMDETSHTKCYNQNNILEVNNFFDCFICGSDQIWNPGWWNNILFLNFTKKNKFSYAASIGRTDLTQEEITFIADNTKDFSKISVREKQIQEILQKNLKKDIEFVLDPTLMVSEEYWQNIAIEPKTSEQYALFYTLGNASQSKEKIYDYCNKKGLKVYTIGFSKNTYFKPDTVFTDYIIKDAGPLEWLGWIKNAEAIYTDSFHAVIFSIIFEKKFTCFEKGSSNDKSNENSRIYSLLDLVGLQNRIVKYDSKVNVATFEESIDYINVKKQLYHFKKLSKKYIEEIINFDI